MTIGGEHPFIGVDLGGTKTELGLVDPDGHLLTRLRFPTPRDAPSDVVIDEILAVVRSHFAKTNAVGIGIGVAGQIDAATGQVLYAPNLEWRNVPLGYRLQQALALPVLVVNDVRAAAFGEWAYGAGQKTEHMICIFVGTGVGGGVVAGGQLLKGCSNAAGELGHSTIVAGGRPCRCSNLGCLEAYVGGWAIARRAQEAAEEDSAAASMLVQLSGSATNITAATVGRAYRNRNPLACRIIDETASYLEAAVVGFVNAFNPCITVLGGGVIEGLPELIDMIVPGVQKRALRAATAPHQIVKAALGGDAGVVGAAMLARNAAIKMV